MKYIISEFLKKPVIFYKRFIGILKLLNEKYNELNLKLDKEKEINEIQDDEEEKRKIHLEYNEKLHEL